MVQTDNIAQELAGLGLTSYETSAYLTLLRRSSFSAAELSRVSGVPRPRIYDVIETLIDKGLCQIETSSPLTVVAISPSLALTALSTRQVNELKAEEVKVQGAATSLAGSLKSLHEQGQEQGAPLSYLDIYRDSAQIAAVAGELGQQAVTEIKVCVTGPPPFLPQGSVRPIGEALSRGVRCRAVLGSAASLSKGFGSLMSTYTGRGLTVRRLSVLLPGPRMLIFDQAAVLLFFSDPLAGPASYQVLAIRHPEMLALMEYAFEGLWEQKQAKELDAQGHTRN